jgi:hypothetical protein
MHTKPMLDSAGAFREVEFRLPCRKCGRKTVTCKAWDSSCGGYIDYKYKCQAEACGYTWWIDGSDA